MKALCEECLRSFDLLDDHDAAEYAYGHDCEGRTEMTIEPGRYPLHSSLEWWNEVNDFVRRRAVAEALDLPVEAVEIVFDSDEEADLASVWLVADGREQAIGHVTTETDGSDGDYLPELRQGMIVVEILDEGRTDMTTTDMTAEDHIRAGHQVRAFWTVEQAADTYLADDGRLIIGVVDDSESDTRFWCATCEKYTEPGPDTEIDYA